MIQMDQTVCYGVTNCWTRPYLRNMRLQSQFLLLLRFLLGQLFLQLQLLGVQVPYL